MLDAGEHATQECRTVADAALALGVTARTLEHLKARFIACGIDSALERKKQARPSRGAVFDGEFAAKLARLACSEPPEGRARWTIQLLVDKLVELKIVKTVSTMTVQRTLKNRFEPCLSLTFSAATP